MFINRALSAWLRPWYPCGIWKSRKSGVRSQNGGGVGSEEPADFFQDRRELLGVSVPEILGENQKVAAFLDGSFGYVHKPSLVRLASPLISLRDMEVEEVRSQKPEWRRCRLRGAC